MTPDRDDPLLEACLDEVLGGRTPPDLTERIMQAWRAQGEANGPQQLATSEQAIEPCRRNGVHTHPRRNTWQLAALAVTACAVALAISATLFLTRPTQLAQHASPPSTKTSSAVADSTSPALDSTLPATADPSARPPSSRPVEVPLASSLPSKAPAESPPAPTTSSPVPAPPQPSSDVEIIAFVNAELARTWSEAGVKPAPAATDADWCRRLFLRLLGRVPTVKEELNPFLTDASHDKRQRLVDRLLSDERYIDEYARHWSVIWTNILIGPTGGRAGSLASREGLEQYLRGALARNKPYHTMVSELLTATGAAQPGAPDYNPAVNFLLDGLDKDATLPTSRVARAFLGQQLQCAQCHNHPSQDWRQEQFWALNTFFRQMKSEQQGNVTKLVNADFRGQGQGPRDGKVFFETPEGLLKTAVPQFIDGTRIPDSGDLAVVDRRRELAALVVRSDLLSKAAVNRVWSHFFGFGFTRPVDDMGPKPSPPAAEVLGRLAREFTAHNYDLKGMLRWIALSDPFSRSSEVTDLATRDMPEAGELALFSRYYARPTPGQDLDGALVRAAQLRKSAKSEADIVKARIQSLAQFNRRPTTGEVMDGGAGQSLIMASGNLMRQAVIRQHAGLLASIAASQMKFEQKVDHLYLSALNRQPTRREQNLSARVLANAKGSQTVALEDIWWAILNSSEFILNE